MSETTTTKTPAFQIVREDAAANGWTMQFFCPSYTVYVNPANTVEVTVWFFQSSGNLEGARVASVNVDEPEAYQVVAEVKRSGLPTVLGWFADCGS